MKRKMIQRKFKVTIIEKVACDYRFPKTESAPRSVGTKMLIMEDGSITGTIGGGCVESEVMQKPCL